jgi:hypothetical protein
VLASKVAYKVWTMKSQCGESSVWWEEVVSVKIGQAMVRRSSACEALGKDRGRDSGALLHELAI